MKKLLLLVPMLLLGANLFSSDHKRTSRMSPFQERSLTNRYLDHLLNKSENRPGSNSGRQTYALKYNFARCYFYDPRGPERRETLADIDSDLVTLGKKCKFNTSKINAILSSFQHEVKQVSKNITPTCLG
jgi:hypothetical protein